MHPDAKAHEETLIIRNSIRYYEIGKYQREFLQATSVMIADWNNCITISAIYLSFKHIIKKEQYITIFKTLSNRFIAAGNYNAKYMH